MSLKLKVLMIGIIMSILISGCVEKQPQNGGSINTSTGPVNTSTSTLFFPVQKNPKNVQMTALLKGELVLINGCLRVDNYLLVWPYGFSISREGEVIQILDIAGKPIAYIGDKVKLGGGEMPSKFVAQYSSELPSDRCSGPYWIVGQVITSD